MTSSTRVWRPAPCALGRRYVKGTATASQAYAKGPSCSAHPVTKYGIHFQAQDVGACRSARVGRVVIRRS